MEKDATDLNHNLLRCKASWAFEKRSLKETEEERGVDPAQRQDTGT